MKKITEKVWFVPLVIGVIITMTLITFRYRDEWFSSNPSTYNVNDISWETANTALENLEYRDSNSFMIVFGNSDCSACITLYETLTLYGDNPIDPSAGFIPAYVTNSIDHEQEAQDFFDQWIFREIGFAWGSQPGERIQSPSTPITIIVMNGVITEHVVGATSAVTDISLTIRNLYRVTS